MEIATEILDNLKFLGYNGKFLKNELLEAAITAGPKSEEFRELIHWVCYEIHILRNTEEQVRDTSEFSEFMLELSGLLKELGCQYDTLVAGPLTDRYQTKESRYLLFDYLISELMASKMNFFLKPQDTSYVIAKSESCTARALETITKDLQLGKPPDNIGPKALFVKITTKLGQVLKQQNPKKISQPIFKLSKPLTAQQWERLEAISKDLSAEYSLRKNMLMTRLDVTIQSFQWSDKMRGKSDEIVNRYQAQIRKATEVSEDEQVSSDLVNLLAARSDLAIIEKTSNATVRKNTGSKVQKHVIGRVPDRGGRAYEHAPPPPEMPSWQQQRSSGPAGGHGGGRGGFNRGGQNQNFSNNQRQQFNNQQQYNNKPQNYQQQNYQQQNNPHQQQQQQYSGGSNNNWVQGNSRVQGGWSNKGNSDGGYRSNNSNYNDNNSGYQDRRGSGDRGRSNYNRGGYRN